MHINKEQWQFRDGDHLSICKFTREDEEDARLLLLAGGVEVLMEARNKAIGKERFPSSRQRLGLRADTFNPQIYLAIAPSSSRGRCTSCAPTTFTATSWTRPQRLRPVAGLPRSPSLKTGSKISQVSAGCGSGARRGVERVSWRGTSSPNASHGRERSRSTASSASLRLHAATYRPCCARRSIRHSILC
jgi:hypothetical protein